ncbi:MAG: SDR family oxidoreductase [Cytophagales bacterium]|nr:SDR family oxidoreductase [Cytophagales bacterium]
MRLKNSKILITGGSLGIGKATAKLLVESGAQVAITGRNKERLQNAAKETGAFPIIADVSKKAAVKRTFGEFIDKYGNLDCLINNAGIGTSKKLEELTLDDFHKVYAVNVFGAAIMAQKAAEIFRKQNYGHIINIGSTAANKGYERGTIYASSKFALKAMTQCWQAELRKYNVRVMLINPSEVTTAFGDPQRVERASVRNKLRSIEIAHTIKSALEMDDRGFIPELTVWATNPWD